MKKEFSMERKRYTLCILVEDIPGVLSQVARLFSRKGYNIESIVSGETDRPGITRISIELLGDELMIDQIAAQCRKLLPVKAYPNGLQVRLLQGQAFKNGQLLDLTAADYKLLCLFLHNPNTVLTKELILEKLWDRNENYIDSSTLTVYIRRLRMKIEDDPSNPKMLLTVRGMGYKWNVLA